MEEEIPKCNSCGQPMFEIGGIGKTQTWDIDAGSGRYRGAREVKLYQCPECKDIKLI